MKETKLAQQEEEIEPETVEDHEISFADTQNFHFWSTSDNKPEEKKEEPVQEGVIENQLPVEETNSELAEEKIEETPEVQSAWKPMSVESNMPDSLISKSEQASAPEIQSLVVEAAPVTESEGITEETQSTEAVKEEVLPVVETSETEDDNAALSESTEEEKR